LPGAAFADVDFRFYPGLYIGADWDRSIDKGMITFGADMQLGIEFDYDDYILGLFGDIGLDTGQPNEPNFYYGGLTELYFLGDYGFRLGAALGLGWNTGSYALKTDDGPIHDSFYIRLGMPVKFADKIKYGFYCDFYLGIGSRLGILYYF
jgi:hypothetical protein